MIMTTTTVMATVTDTATEAAQSGAVPPKSNTV